MTTKTIEQKEVVDLGRALRTRGYQFIAVTPATHRRVLERADAQGRASARTLRDAFGWNRPFSRTEIEEEIFDLALRAGILVAQGEARGESFRSRVRFSTLEQNIYVHSSYPTSEDDAVFFGPDTYRYCRFIRESCRDRRFRRAVDIGAGTGVGGLVAREFADEVVLSDVNERALEFAAVNVALADTNASTTSLQKSDVLRDIEGPIDLVVANPPYMADPKSRAYRDGGGEFGEELTTRIVRESIERLSPGGRLVLYTGAAIVDGVDQIQKAVLPLCEGDGIAFRYEELDPDVFGEEITTNDAYARVERIAAVGLVVTKA